MSPRTEVSARQSVSDAAWVYAGACVRGGQGSSEAQEAWAAHQAAVAALVDRWAALVEVEARNTAAAR